MRVSTHTQAIVRAVSISATLLVAACASTRTVSTPSSDRFDPQAVAWSKKAGANSIVGTAELVTRNGERKTCAGLEVRLVPDAPYTRDRVSLLYGTTSEGFVDTDEARRVQANSEAAVDPAYARSHKVASCNAKGGFTFANLADGSYYVLAPVVWKPRDAQTTEGGFLMQRVRVAGGETKRLHLTPPSRISQR